MKLKKDSIAAMSLAMALITAPLAMMPNPLRSTPVRKRKVSSALQKEVIASAEAKRARRALRLCKENR